MPNLGMLAKFGAFSQGYQDAQLRDAQLQELKDTHDQRGLQKQMQEIQLQQQQNQLDMQKQAMQQQQNIAQRMQQQQMIQRSVEQQKTAEYLKSEFGFDMDATNTIKGYEEQAQQWALIDPKKADEFRKMASEIRGEQKDAFARAQQVQKENREEYGTMLSTANTPEGYSSMLGYLQNKMQDDPRNPFWQKKYSQWASQSPLDPTVQQKIKVESMSNMKAADAARMAAEQRDIERRQLEERRIAATEARTQAYTGHIENLEKDKQKVRANQNYRFAQAEYKSMTKEYDDNYADLKEQKRKLQTLVNTNKATQKDINPQLNDINDEIEQLNKQYRNKKDAFETKWSGIDGIHLINGKPESDIKGPTSSVAPTQITMTKELTTKQAKVVDQALQSIANGANRADVIARLKQVGIPIADE